MNLPTRITDLVAGAQLDFERRITAASPVQYAQEAHFALQQLAANSYLLGIAQNNPDSLRAALRCRIRPSSRVIPPVNCCKSAG